MTMIFALSNMCIYRVFYEEKSESGFFLMSIIHCSFDFRVVRLLRAHLIKSRAQVPSNPWNAKIKITESAYNSPGQVRNVLN